MGCRPQEWSELWQVQCGDREGNGYGPLATTTPHLKLQALTKCTSHCSQPPHNIRECYSAPFIPTPGKIETLSLKPSWDDISNYKPSWDNISNYKHLVLKRYFTPSKVPSAIKIFVFYMYEKVTLFQLTSKSYKDPICFVYVCPSQCACHVLCYISIIQAGRCNRLATWSRCACEVCGHPNSLIAVLELKEKKFTSRDWFFLLHYLWMDITPRSLTPTPPNMKKPHPNTS